MGLFDLFKKQAKTPLPDSDQQVDERLIGYWEADPAELSSMDKFGNVIMAFTEDGKLIYDVLDKNKLHRVNMTYYIKSDIIYTNQSSHPAEHKTKYWFDDKARLNLEYDGVIGIFICARRKGSIST